MIVFSNQNLQAVQSMGRWMDWTLEDNMVNGLICCATLANRRSGQKRPKPVPRHLIWTLSCAARNFCSGWVNRLIYVRLFLPFISEQLKIGVKHQ